jgi:polar amino acid transport system substrate-binding protein
MGPRQNRRSKGACIVSLISKSSLGNWLSVRVLLIVGVIATSWVATITAAPIVKAQEETLVFCSDLAFPPMEFLEGSEPVGADIDIGNEVAERIGRTAEFTNIGFDGIIAALQSDLCDAIISGMNNTPERAEQVDFVNYLFVGPSLVVQVGNPEGITSLETLCGHAAGSQVGSTNLDTLNEANEACIAAGKEGIDVTGFPADTDGILALKADRIDAYETDSPVAAYYIAQDPQSFEFGGPAIDALPVGIALRKDSTELRDQIQAAIDEMYADGTMMEILEKWQLQDFALPEAVGATPVATPAGS